MWAKASISPLPSWLGRRGKHSRPAKPIVHISTGFLVTWPRCGRPAARAALEAAGCTLKDYGFALGPADVVVIYEAPDAITAASVSMMLGASGASSSVETVQLFTMEDALTAMAKAGQIRKTYKPPTSA